MPPKEEMSITPAEVGHVPTEVLNAEKTKEPWPFHANNLGPYDLKVEVCKADSTVSVWDHNGNLQWQQLATVPDALAVGVYDAVGPTKVEDIEVDSTDAEGNPTKHKASRHVEPSLRLQFLEPGRWNAMVRYIQTNASKGAKLYIEVIP